MHQGHLKLFRMAMTKHECLWTFQLWFEVVVDKLNGYTKYPKSSDFMYTGNLLYYVDHEIILQTMLYVFIDDEHKMKIENRLYFFRQPLGYLFHIFFFLNSIKEEKKLLYTPTA